MSQRVPLPRIIETIEARGRAVVKWPGNMKPETVETIALHCSLGAQALRVVSDHAAGLRHLIEFLQARQTDARRRLLANPTDAEAAALLSHPAVRAVVEAFPTAMLDHVETISGQAYANPDGATAPPEPAESESETEEDTA